MANIKNLQPEQVVYTVVRQKVGNTTMKRGALFEVKIKEVNVEEGWVVASINCNPVRKYYLSDIAKWKVKKPAPKANIGGLPSY